MTDILKNATWGAGAKISRILKISPQGWSSKVRSQPLNTVKETLLALKALGKTRAAWLVIEDFNSFVRTEFENASVRKFKLWEIIEKLHNVIRYEIDNSNRIRLLEAWRELQLVAGFRIREITDQLQREAADAVPYSKPLRRKQEIVKKSRLRRFFQTLSKIFSRKQ